MAAGPVGLNFIQGPGDTLGATEQAGAPTYVQANWNSGIVTGTGVAVVDSTGAATGLTVSWHANDIWQNSASRTTPDTKLMYGYLDSGAAPIDNSSPYQFAASGNSPEVYIQGLTAWMAGQGAVSYDVVVYFSGDTLGRIGEYWLQQAAGTDANGLPNALGPDLTSHVFASMDANFSGTYTNVPLTAVDNSTAAVGSYLVFPGVTSDNFIIRNAKHNFRALISAIQVVPRTTIAPPIVALSPQSQVKFAGGKATFSVGADGTNLRYQWMKNASPILNATNSSLTVSPTLADNGSQYSVVVSNDASSATSDAATLTVVSAPAANSFAGTVLADKPLGYWRFNDVGNVVSDYVGSRNALSEPSAGTDGGAYALTPSSSFLGFEPANTGWAFTGVQDSSVFLQNGFGGVTNAMTFVEWVYPTGPNGVQASWTGVLLTTGVAGSGAGITYTDHNNELGYQWNNRWDFRSGLVVPDQQWSMIAMVVTPSNVTLYLVNPTTGLLSAVDGRATNAPCNFNNETWLGVDSGFAGSRNFVGSMDELAVFDQSLSQSQILSLYSAGRAAGSLPPSISQQPVSEQVFAGETIKFTVVASATGTMTYQWKNASGNVVNSAHISGAQSDTLIISNVVAGDVGSYSVNVKSPAGTVTSDTVTLSLATPTGAAYEAAVIAAQPYAYWRFNEATGTNAFDNIGGHTAIYGAAAALGAVGPQPTDFPGFETANTSMATFPGIPNAYATVRGLNLNTNALTITGWIYSGGGQDPATGFLFNRDGATESGLCYRDSTLSYTWAGNWDWHSTLTIPDSQWVFIALVVEPNQGTVFMGTNGVLMHSIRTMTHASQSFAGLTSLGADNLGNNRIFNGMVDEFAVFNRSLSHDEIANLYKQATGIPVVPTITTLTSTNQFLWTGTTATFTVDALGSSPLSYQWYKGASALVNGGNVTGATTPSLTVANLTPSDAGNYTLVVTGPTGQATNDVTTIQLGVPPNRPYDVALLAANPVAFWRLNETNGTVAHDSVGAFDATYGSAIHLGVGAQPSQGMFGFGSDTLAAQFTHNTDQSWVTVPPLNLNANTVTIMAWIYPTTQPDNWSGLFVSQDGSRAGMMFRNNAPNTAGFMWNNGNFWGTGTGMNIAVGQWSLVSLSIAPDSATINVINSSGTQTYSDTTDTMNPEPFSGISLIGCDTGNTGREFNGLINNVAVFKRTLSNVEIQGFYTAAVTPQLGVITLQIQNTGTSYQLTWPRGALYEADQVGGTWTAVPNAASPYPVDATSTNKFYRVISPN